MTFTKLMFSSIALVLIVSTLLCVLSPSQATYRKPPFNGSIFGKRSGVMTSGEYDAAGKTLSAMCEIANEACQSWFPSQEK